VWEALQYLIAALDRSETEAAELLHTLGGYGDRARQLAYLCYQKAKRKRLGRRSRRPQQPHHHLAQPHHHTHRKHRPANNAVAGATAGWALPASGPRHRGGASKPLG